MNRAMLEDHLAAAERHLAEAQRYVAHQRELVAQLEREGHDTAQDTRLLEQYEEVLAMHIADRNRLRRQLGQEIGLQERLDQNERNVSEVERHIERLHELMGELQRGGNDLRLTTNMLRRCCFWGSQLAPASLTPSFLAFEREPPIGSPHPGLRPPDKPEIAEMANYVSSKFISMAGHALAHLSLLRELAMDSQRLLAIAIIFLAMAIIFATLVGAWMFRYEPVGSGLVTHRNRFTGAVCRIEEDCWFRSY